ncbi:MAG: type IV pilus twitching motility protein PilT [Phycisphaerae bacterium]|nr:type IV pilus twitching motility protein PilT [Phycisphaerae bacterium]
MVAAVPLKQILADALRIGASDVHLIVGLPPLIRLHTLLQPTDLPLVSPESTHQMALDMLGEERFDTFQKKQDLDFSTEVPGLGRFRVNAHFQNGSIAIAMRAIQDRVRPLEELNLPEAISNLPHLPRGLVLVTGDTGSGKSTTLAAMIDKINRTYAKHIITLEDPIEYSLRSAKSAIEQREIGHDCPDFASGLKHVLRQDPDVILVGEMRDLETSRAAITAAETGHLVLSTLHTNNAPQTIERIIDIYPEGEQNQIRSMLANTLQAVVSQVLFKRIDQPGMVPGVEVMICTPALRNCIRENRIFEIPNIIETNRMMGMQTMDEAIKTLYLNGKISRDDALSKANFPDKLHQAMCA